MPGRALQRLFHEVSPGRYRHASRLIIVIAQRALRIEPGPDGRDEVAIEAIEPGVVKIVAGACLAGDVIAIERAGALARAALDDIGHHVRQQVRDLRSEDLRRQILLRDQCLTIVRRLVQQRRAAAGGHAFGARTVAGNTALRAGDRRVGLLQDLAIGVLNAIDVVGADFEAPVGES